MPWTYDDPPAVAQNWTEAEQRRCVDAANAVLEAGGTDQEAIYACIAAAGKRADASSAFSAGTRVRPYGRREMLKKTYRSAIELKEDGQPGEFRAVFSTFNVIDHDNDVTLPGAFTEGEKVRIGYWGHRWQDLPVGRGEIHQDEEKAWVDGRFFLDTEPGQQTYLTVKNLEELQEWSYGFDIVESRLGEFEEQDVQFLERLTVYEVSPVMLGAGIGTRTETIKSTERSAGKITAEAVTTNGDSDNAGNDEGQTGDGDPSGPPPRVVSTQIEIDLLEV